MFQNLIADEKILIKVKTKNGVGFWQYQILGLLSLFMDRDNNYFIITEKRVLIIVKNKIELNSIYSDFSKIKFNSKSDMLSFQNKNNETQNISLSALELEYDDYKYIKHQLN